MPSLARNTVKVDNIDFVSLILLCNNFRWINTSDFLRIIKTYNKIYLITKYSYNSTHWGQWFLGQVLWLPNSDWQKRYCIEKCTYQLAAFLIKAKTVALTLITIVKFTLKTRNKLFFHKRWLDNFFWAGCETYELLIVSGKIVATCPELLLIDRVIFFNQEF